MSDTEAMRTAFEQQYTDRGLKYYLTTHYDETYKDQSVELSWLSFKKGWEAHGKHLIAAIDNQVNAFRPDITMHDVAKSTVEKCTSTITMGSSSKLEKVGNLMVGPMMHGDKIVAYTLVDKADASGYATLDSNCPPSLMPNAKEYHADLNNEWRYIGIDDDPPASGKIDVLTVGGVSIQGTANTVGMIAWAYLRKRDKEKEEQQKCLQKS